MDLNSDCQFAGLQIVFFKNCIMHPWGKLLIVASKVALVVSNGHGMKCEGINYLPEEPKEIICSFLPLILHNTIFSYLSHIRPRPPPPESSPSRRFLHHDIIEANKGGWWSGIVMAVAATSIAIAFPITRHDYIGSDRRAAQVLCPAVPGWRQGQVVRTHDLYGSCSWFPATVVKAVDPWSCMVECIDQEEGNPWEKATEPAVEHSPPDSKFCFMMGAAVKAYCDGSWSPGVHRVVGEAIVYGP
ncbi:hypothetical protein EJB05_27259, partial [Eragrostis curvula]